MLKDIILGFSCNVDYELILDESNYQKIFDNYDIDLSSLSELYEVNNKTDLLSIILYSMQNGKGGEYFVKDIEIINDFVNCLNYKVTLGGTAIRCAYALNLLNKNFFVHLSTYNDLIKKIIPQNFNYIFPNIEQNLYPHLIVQYPANLKLELKNNNITSKKSDRLIFVNDPINENIKINQDIFKNINRCKIFLFSGLNCIKNNEIVNKLLSMIKGNFHKIPKNSFSYYEDSNYHSNTIAKKVRNFFYNNTDFCGLNEDEFSEFTNSTDFKLDPYILLQELKDFKKHFKTKFIVLHTSKWSLIYGHNSKRFENCIISAVTLSTARMKYGDNLTKKTLIQFRKEIVRHKDFNTEFCDYFKKVNNNNLFFHPSIELNLKKPTTVGLGDIFVGGFLASLSEINF